MSVVHHRRIEIDGVETFYREAGRYEAPTLLLPHGYPCSSYEFRGLMTRLGGRYRLLAPDFPAWGFSETPETFPHDFDGYARFLERFADYVGANKFALYLHDFGSQIGLRLAIASPERITALIIQNGDIYEDQLGPNYKPLIAYWDDPTAERKAELAEAISEAISEAGYRDEFLNGSDAVADRISPDLWALHWALTPIRKQIYLDVIAGLRENRLWFPRYQAYLREHQPPTLIVWGPNDGFMPKGAGQAYLRDIPAAELHFIEDGGHWLLETHLDQVTNLITYFLDRNV